MWKLLNEMKQTEGQASPTALPGDGADSSDYFRLQRKLERLQPDSLRKVATPKNLTPSRPSAPSKKESVSQFELKSDRTTRRIGQGS